LSDIPFSLKLRKIAFLTNSSSIFAWLCVLIHFLIHTGEYKKPLAVNAQNIWYAEHQQQKPAMFHHQWWIVDRVSSQALPPAL